MSLYTQDESLRRLEARIMEEVNDRFPRELNGYTLRLENVKLVFPYDPTNFGKSIEAQEKAYRNDETITLSVTGTLAVEKDGKVEYPFKSATLARIPFITNRGTYIVQGNETTFINRSTQRDGVFINPIQDMEEGEVIKAVVRVGKTRFEFAFNTTKLKFMVNNLKTKYSHPKVDVDIFTLLRIFGATEGEVESAFGNKDLYESVKSQHTRTRQTIQDIFRKMFPKDVYRNEEEAKEKIRNFFNTTLAFDEYTQNVVKETIQTSSKSFDKQAMLNTIKQMVSEYKVPGSNLISEDIRFKKVETGEDMLAEGFGTGLDRWVIDHVTDVLKDKTPTMNRIRPRFINEWVEKVYSGSSYREFADTPNPLALLQAKQKITALGDRGIKADYAKDFVRDLSDTSFAKIDPVETPQSKNMGLVQHFARDVEVKDGTVYSTFYRVKDGIVDRGKTVNDIHPIDEYNEYIAFYDPRQMELKNGQWTFKGPEVRVRHRGTFLNVPIKQVTLVDKNRDGLFGYATALIPFGSHNDGARMLMGANMQGQAIALRDAEVPLVQNVDDNGETIEKQVAEKASFLLKSPHAGRITKILDDVIVMEDAQGNEYKVPKLNYFTNGKMGGYINHKPIVNVGDEVKVGQTLADGWQSKNGELALGTNALTAYMPFQGYNFEDGVVISESFAKRLTSEEVKTLEFNELDFPKDVVKVADERGEAFSLFRKTQIQSESAFKNLDKRGVVKKGAEIMPGDILVAAVKKTSEAKLKKLPPLKAMLWDPAPTKRAQGYQKGKVIDVQVMNTSEGTKVIIKLLAYKPMEIGDKLAGRHGNKGIVTKILPDNEMPQTEDKKAIDIIFSPLAIPSRKNLGQLLEVNAGLVAMKKGLKSYGVKNFDPTERERVMNDLKDIGYADGKMTLIDPTTGKPYENAVTVGPAYIMKLKHKVENKITRRNMDGHIDPVLNMPGKRSGSIDGERTNPQGISAMEFWSLTSAGAVQNIHEMNTLKSDGAGDREARRTIFNALRRGDATLPEPATPETLKAMKNMLAGVNINMIPLKNGKAATIDEQFTSLMLQPMSPEKFAQMGAKPITTFNKSYEAYRKGNKNYVSGGLLDPAIFGEDGDQWGYAPLTSPIANPIYFKSAINPYQVLLKHTVSEEFNRTDTLKGLIGGETFVMLEPGDTDYKKFDLISKEEVRKLWDQGQFFDADTGSSALHQLLQGITPDQVKSAYSKVTTELKSAKKIKEKSDAEREFRVLSNMLDNNIKPTDFMVHQIPILPSKYRPAYLDGEFDIIDSMNQLYQKSLKQEERFGKTESKIQTGFEHINKAAIPVGKPDELPSRILMDPEFYAKKELQRFESLEHLFGTSSSKYRDTKTDQEWQGILHRFQNKSGFIRSKMQRKMQDYSGRSVIVVDPTLDLDEVSLPEDMAIVMFDPQITRELERIGYTPERIMQIKASGTKEKVFRDVLHRVAAQNPVILNRQPSLHRHSVQAFYPKIREGSAGKSNRAIGLNPLVTTGFNADFDGDTMAVHVPISEAAKKEAIEKLMPSRNLYNPTNNGLIMELKHEMQLGIFYMTRNVQPRGMAKTYKDLAELRKAYDKGQVGTYDAAIIEGHMDTVGKHLFNQSLPRFARDYKDNVDIGKKKLEKLITRIVQDQRGGTMEAVKVLNSLRNLSFHVSTKSGMSIGIADFQGVTSYRDDATKNNQLMDRATQYAQKKLDEEVNKQQDKGIVMDFIDRREKFDQFKADFVSEELRKALEKDSPLSKDNPVTIMQMSGARGNASQITGMAGIVGVGKKVTLKSTRAIMTSHLEGLSPDQFWDLSGDSRKGIYDKSIASQSPGYLTRQMWMSNKQTVITEKDCGDTRGIMLQLANDTQRRNLRGRVLLTNLSLPNGVTIMATKLPLTVQDVDVVNKYYDNFKNQGTPTTVTAHVRSPLTCKSPTGVCQLCYGSRAGDPLNRLVPIGEPVGSLAAQAIGEPSQQAIMRTFHTGGASSSTNAFNRIRDVLKITNDQKAHLKAVLSKVDGTVQAIEKDGLNNTTITIKATNGKIEKVVIPPMKPVDPTIVIGAPVHKGQSLTMLRDADGNTTYTYKDAKEVLELQGMAAAQQYLLDELNFSLDKGKMGDNDMRHTEVIISNMANHARVESGGNSPFRTGQMASRKAIEHYNETIKRRAVTMSLDFSSKPNVVGAMAAEKYHDKANQVIVEKGQQITDVIWERLRASGRKNIKIHGTPVAYKPELIGLSLNPQQFRESSNWFNSAGFEHVRSAITTGAAVGAEDKLDNPLTRQMAGKLPNIAEGYAQWTQDFEDLY